MHREDGPAEIINYDSKFELYYFLFDIDITNWLTENNFTMPLTEEQMIFFKIKFL